MKIGVVTFWHSEENYGELLQCYALVRYLKDKGHDAQLIKTKAVQTTKSRLLDYLSLLLTPSKLMKIISGKVNKQEKKKVEIIKRDFSSFREAHIPSTENVYTFMDLCDTTLDYDVIICGSDQIWNGLSPIMYLQFPGLFKRIAYAASFGGYRCENYLERRKQKKWLESFDLVTVREKEGVEICNDYGIKAYHVPDPTLLHDSNFYCTNLHISKKESEPYIFVYLLGSEIELTIDEITTFAREHKLNIQYVASQGRDDKMEKIYPTIEGWLGLIKGADYVITNSFHGTVFSLIFSVPFLTVPITGARAKSNNRIYELLSKYNLNGRIYSGDLKELIKPVDFSQFERSKKEDQEMVEKLFKEIM